MHARSLIGRVSGFTISTALIGLTNAAVIPLLLAQVGVHAWSEFALGQSIGSIFAIFIGYGWAVTGVATIAGSRPSTRVSALRQSYAMRVTLAFPSTILAFVIGYFSYPNQSLASASMASAYALAGLSSSWYHIGSGRPIHLLSLETLPRVAALFVGLSILALGAPIVWYPVSIALFNCGVMFLNLLVITGKCVISAEDFAGTRRLFLVQLPALSTSATSAVYLNLPIVAVSMLAPSGLPAFALADRLFKIVNMAASPLIQTLQGWVASGDKRRALSRIRAATITSVILGFFLAVLFIVGARPGASLLSHNKISIGIDLTVAFGVTLIATVISQVVGIGCLSMLGRISAVAKSAAVGAILCLPMLAVGTYFIGAAGAAWSQTLAELGVTSFQLNSLRSSLQFTRALQDHA